jgi:hypothetical protein
MASARFWTVGNGEGDARTLPRSYLFLCALACALAGCEEAREADLLDVRSVGPSQLDPGHPLVIEGGPFALHHDVEVRLIGELARAFETPERIEESFAAHAVSEDRIEVPIAERVLRERFRRATFRGRVEVREAALWGELPGAVLGRASDIVVELVPPRSAAPSERTLDRVLGVRWSEGSDRWLTVEHADADGRGAAAGIALGDVVVGEGDARFVRGDVPIVPERATDLHVVVERDGVVHDVLVTIGGARETDGQRDLARLAQLAIVIAWLALLRTMPLRAIEHAVPRPAPALARPTTAMLARAAAALVISIALVRALASGALPSASFVIATVLGARATLLFVDARGELRRAWPIALSSLGLATGLAAIPLALGTADLASLTRDGAASPLSWAVFAEPVGPLALAAVAVALATAAPRTRIGRSVDDVLVIAIAALVVVECTGLSPVGRAGTTALTMTTAIVAAALGHTRGALPTLPATVAILLLTTLTALVLGAWSMADPSPLARTTAAETLLAMCVLAALFALRHATSRPIASRAANALL